MMTRKDALVLYAENDYGVYKYIIRREETSNELIKFVEAHPNNTGLYYYLYDDIVDRGTLFDIENIRFILYYHERDIELAEEIGNNEILSNEWSDSDCYTLEDEQIQNMKAITAKTKILILDLLKLNSQFKKLVK